MSDTFVTSRFIVFLKNKFHYGWVIVAVCSLTMALAYGIMYSFSVFFKPIVAQFQWDRATVSSIYSLSIVSRGAVSIGIGWLADRYGAMKLSVFCGVMIVTGLLLASRVTQLWQFYVAFGLFLSIGLSGAYPIGSAVTSRWFKKKRGMALGVVAAGSGFGTLTIVPLGQFLINQFNWSTAFMIFGIGGGILVISTAFFLKPAPNDYGNLQFPQGTVPNQQCETGISFKKAIFTKELLILIVTFTLVNFCIQMIMIHLVNFATDIGISSFQAAGFVGIIGVVSIVGRLFMGGASDRIGTYPSIVACCILLLAAFILLIFNRSLWGFYLFTILFGFAYGGEVPQLPMMVAQIFGIRAMAALMGIVVFISTIGGALGPWIAGRIFDQTAHYQYAFVVAAAASLLRLVLVVGYKKYLIPHSFS
jgi:MFS family permease